jgi:hypothetical protein
MGRSRRRQDQYSEPVDIGEPTRDGLLVSLLPIRPGDGVAGPNWSPTVFIHSTRWAPTADGPYETSLALLRLDPPVPLQNPELLEDEHRNLPLGNCL